MPPIAKAISPPAVSIEEWIVSRENLADEKYRVAMRLPTTGRISEIVMPQATHIFFGDRSMNAHWSEMLSTSLLELNLIREIVPVHFSNL